MCGNQTFVEIETCVVASSRNDNEIYIFFKPLFLSWRKTINMILSVVVPQDKIITTVAYENLVSKSTNAISCGLKKQAFSLPGESK